jgi:predicted transcriptional regulator
VARKKSPLESTDRVLTQLEFTPEQLKIFVKHGLLKKKTLIVYDLTEEGKEALMAYAKKPRGRS